MDTCSSRLSAACASAPVRATFVGRPRRPRSTAARIASSSGVKGRRRTSSAPLVKAAELDPPASRSTRAIVPNRSGRRRRTSSAAAGPTALSTMSSAAFGSSSSARAAGTLGVEAVSMSQWRRTSSTSDASVRRARTTARGFGIGERGALVTDQEPVSLPRDGLDELGAAPIVLELHAKVAHVAIDEVALGDVVGPPERIEDRLAVDGLAGIRRQEIQERLLDRGELQHRRPRADLAIEQVDLEPADLDDRDERDRLAVRAAHQRERARDELLRA